MAERILIVDGNSLMFRAFYAMPELTAPDGAPVGAVYGFLGMLLKAMDDYAPTRAAVAFDLKGPTFRHLDYEAYKAGRKPTPDPLRPQFPLLKDILRAMEVPVVEKEGYEADDILGTLAEQSARAGVEAVIVTGDRDALQLVRPGVRVVITRKGISQTEEYDEALLRERYGLTPAQIPDLKGLMGDSSDNIPGVPGIGEKTALRLLHAYGSVEGVLSHAGELTGRQRELVETGAESARFSRRMATICRDVPLEIGPADCALRPLHETGLIPMLEKLSFGSILRRVRAMGGAAPAPEVPVRALRGEADVASAAEALAARGCVAVWMGEALSMSDGAVEYRIPLRTDLLGGELTPDAALAALAPVFESEAVKAVWDAKEWLHRLGSLGVRARNLDRDIMIAGWLLAGGDAPGSAAALAERHLGRALEPAPAATLWRLWETMEEELARQGMTELYDAMERPLIGVLRDMEAEGFPVDPAVLRELGDDMERKLGGLTARIHEYAGDPFNINSPRQLGEVLFVKLGLPVVKSKKTGWSTDIEVLETLEDRHPIIPLIMEYRQLSKLKGTYIDGLLPLVGGDGRIRTRFVQTGTSTGRLSSAEPNLQNIPVRLPEGRQIRRAFVSGGPGRALVDADYSQIELRVLAHMSGDPGLIAAFLRGDDIHRRTASQVFGVSMDEVTGEMRGSAKAVNFGIVYGISDFGLSRQLGISRAQAGRYIEKYLDAFSGVRAFMERTLALGREQGYVETLFHRRRAVPGLTSGNYAVRSSAERMAMNAPIQGTAADIIKLAMIAVHRALERRNLGARLILQVHDELIVDAPAETVQEIAQLMKSAMEEVVSLKVPLIAEVAAASNWYDAK